MADARLIGALDHRSDLGQQRDLSVELSVVTDTAMIDLRGLPGDKAFMAAAKSVLGIALPERPRTSATKGDVTILWLSVDQWLVTLPRDQCARVLATLRKKTEAMFALACDVSDARTIIRIEGNGVREVLMKGTSTDLFSPAVSAGTVRRMLFAEISAACHIRRLGPDCVDLYVFRSYANYAWEWLLATSRSSARVTLFTEQQPPAV